MAEPTNPARKVSDINEEVFNAGAASVVGTIPETAAFNVKKYPKNLGDHEYPHYVMFFIHVRKSDISSLENKPEVASLQFDLSQSNAIPKTGQFANAARVVQYGAASAAIGAKINKGILNAGIDAAGGAANARQLQTFNNIAAAFGGLTGAIVGGSVGAAVTTQDDRTQVVLKDAIALYITGTPSTTYNAVWDVEDMGMIGAGSQQLMDTLSGSSSGVDKLLSLIKNAGGGMAQSFVMKQARELNFAGGNVGAFAESATGQVANPFKTQLFKNMDFRTFSFDYTFAPRSDAEYKTVQDIIKTFKLYMHPVLGKEKFVLDYPAEFTLGFYHRAQLNKNLFKVSNCALTNMKVDYGGTDLTTFRDIPGAPSEINMKLTFVELEVLSRERIEVGY
jgi:hypothetical protein